MRKVDSKGPDEKHGRIVNAGFNQRVYALVRQIPRGKVATYGDIAAALGDAKVARHVGWALAALRNSSDGNIDSLAAVPWHRVVNARGTISVGGNPTRPPEQARRLRAEGVSVSADNKLVLQHYRIKAQDLQTVEKK